MNNESRQEYSKRKYAEQKALRDKLKAYQKAHPEEYAARVKVIEERESAKVQAVTDFHNLVGLAYFKAVSVHVCPDLMCQCDIGETPALTSPIIRKAEVCRTCGQTYSALLYNVGWTTFNQHTCSQYGIFIMTAADYKKSSDLDNMNSQWSSKILLAGEGESANIYETKQYYYHNTLKWFKPSKALYAVCTGCKRPILDGMVSFSTKADGESNLMCSRCCNNPQDYPYGFEVREDGVGFFKNSEFNWRVYSDDMRSKAEQELIRYKNIVRSLENMESYDQ